MALYTMASRDEFTRLNRLPRPDQTQIYNALSQEQNQGSNDNFFTRRGKSIGNALGTTGAAAVSFVKDRVHDDTTQRMLNQAKESRQAIAKKYGYADMDALYDALEAAEASGDTGTFNRLSQAEQEDRSLTKKNADAMTKRANEYKDYRENNQISKFINQDPGKFAGSAINTLSTATDVLGLTNGPLTNAIQGGIEGVADELEQNGLQNFDWNRAGQNALAGAASGAAVGAFNKGLNNTLAKNGGKLFAGNNIVTRGINKVANIPGPQRLLGKYGGNLGESAEGIINTIGQGVLRGAASGAVGGATGAGVSAALNGQDVLGSALRGAQQGIGQGAMAGGIMAGANMTLSKTPLMQKINEAQQETKTENELAQPVNERQVAKPIETKDSQNDNLIYGDSALANRTKRGMLADSLERFGNTLEGAQTNVTRAAAKDLGIESTGKVIENIRKRTGITNLETQARLAKELTGGENSLMDNIQKIALTASEDGNGYAVDTTPLLRDIDSIVGKYADTNMFGSQSARTKFIDNLKADISSYEGDVLSIANRMKANAADLRGKGVASPTPADSAKAKIYTEVANRLDDLSYKSIPQENVDAMFDTAISEMRGRATQAKNAGNNDIAKAYTKLADNLAAEPRTIKAFRSFKKDFVDASKISDLTLQAENGAAAQMGRSFGGGIKRFVNTATQRPINALLAKAGGAVNNVADKIAGETTNLPAAQPTASTSVEYNPATQIFNAIGRTEGLNNAEQARTADYLVDAVQEGEVVPNNTLESLVQPTGTNATSVYNSVYNQQPTMASNTNMGMGGNTYFQPTGDYWTDILGRAMSSAIDADDATAFGSLYAMYQESLSNLQKQNVSNSQQKLTATQQRANAAMNSLERIANMTPDLAYNLSNIPIIGGIATLGGNDYESEAKSLAQQIGYMVSGANIKEEEAYNIGKAYVPQPFDNEQVRNNKLRRAYEIIQQYQSGYSE